MNILPFYVCFVLSKSRLAYKNHTCHIYIVFLMPRCIVNSSLLWFITSWIKSYLAFVKEWYWNAWKCSQAYVTQVNSSPNSIIWHIFLAVPSKSLYYNALDFASGPPWRNLQTKYNLPDMSSLFSWFEEDELSTALSPGEWTQVSSSWLANKIDVQMVKS